MVGDGFDTVYRVLHIHCFICITSFYDEKMNHRECYFKRLQD